MFSFVQKGQIKQIKIYFQQRRPDVGGFRPRLDRDEEQEGGAQAGEVGHGPQELQVKLDQGICPANVIQHLISFRLKILNG